MELDRCRHFNQRLCASHYILDLRPMGNLTLIANMALKLATAILVLHREAMGSFKYKRRVTDTLLPKISIMVPLFKESAIMSHLLTNLRQLDYPKTLLQVIW